jgi:Domain of unknown function (DUF4287)/Domain of unknown function (DUF5655)
MASVQDAIAWMVKNIETSTGKKISAWIALARETGFGKHGEILTWLKSKHGLGHGYANYVAKEALKADGEGADDLVTSQFSGAKAVLRPLYDQLIALMESLGKDLEIAPKKNNVSIRRSKQFAVLQASTSSRLDIGLVLKASNPTAGSRRRVVSMRCSHIVCGWPIRRMSTPSSRLGSRRRSRRQAREARTRRCAAALTA